MQTNGVLVNSSGMSQDLLAFGQVKTPNRQYAKTKNTLLFGAGSMQNLGQPSTQRHGQKNLWLNDSSMNTYRSKNYSHWSENTLPL